MKGRCRPFLYHSRRIAADRRWGRGYRAGRDATRCRGAQSSESSTYADYTDYTETPERESAIVIELAAWTAPMAPARSTAP